MAARDEGSGPESPRLDELVLTRVGGDAVIRPLGSVSMDEVRRALEAERSRNRRAIVWTGTLLLGVFLFFLVIFLSVGIFVIRTREQTARELLDLRAREAQQIGLLGAVSNRLSVLESVQMDLNELVKQVETTELTRSRELDAVLADLDKLRDVMQAQNEERATRQAQVDERLREATNATQQELVRISGELERALSSLAASASGAGMPFAAGGVPSAALLLAAEAGAGTGEETPAAPTVDLDSLELTDASLQAAGVFALPEDEPYEPGSERREIQVVNFPNGDRFEGELQSGVMHGWGIYTSQQGDRYDGQFRGGMREGRGTLVYANGDRYIGEFRMDMRHGRGSLVTVIGDRYAGQLANDVIAGKGCMVYANGNKYAGDFAGGLRHGIGILRFANGDIYRGEFREDLRTGQGVYAFADGSRYVGGFVNGRRHGQGKYLYATGEEFVGEFHDGSRQGMGLSIFPNGKQVKGLWEGDKLVRHLSQ